MPRIREWWKTTSIIAAAPGWRALYFNNDTHPASHEIVGWAMQMDMGSEDERTVGCIVEDGEWLQIDSENFWKIIEPDESASSEEYQEAYKRYKEAVKT